MGSDPTQRDIDAATTWWLVNHEPPVPPNLIAAFAKHGFGSTPQSVHEVEHPMASASLAEMVAKAIYDATHAGLSNCYAWDDAWEDYQEAGRERYYKEARAAISALATLHTPPPVAAVGEVERLRAVLAEIAAPIEGQPIGDPWAFYADVRKLAADALAHTPPPVATATGDDEDTHPALAGALDHAVATATVVEAEEVRNAADELRALAALIERPPLDDVQLAQDVALRCASAIRVVLAATPTPPAGGQ